MSLIECNLASGDGVKSVQHRTPGTRTPTPSCRKFATRPLQKTEFNEKKLREALQQITVTPKSSSLLTHKRAQTMAEITPTKRKNVELKLTDCSPIKNHLGKIEAANRIYQKLLLHAWRRRRNQATELSESSNKLEARIIQLQMQVRLLQELRKSESLKRTEAAKEIQQLKTEIEHLFTTLKQHETDKLQKNEEVECLQRKIEQLISNGKNLKNELLSSKSDISIYQVRIQKEEENIMKLMQEKDDLIEKIVYYEKLTTDQKYTIHDLRSSLALSENNLSAVNLKAGILEEEKEELSLKLQQECDLRNYFQEQFIEKENILEILEQKVDDLEKNISDLQETEMNVLDDNMMLKETLKELDAAFKEEKEKKWWKCAASVVLESLRTAAHIMLPALNSTSNNYDLTFANTKERQT